ncbi:MAG: hypothetical protein AAF805_06585, partial [Planctomycetota bacterium]
VENDRLRLVVNVPEARVRELELRRRHVEAVRRGEETAVDPECAVFRANVRLEGTDLFGNEWESIPAEVYRIAESADAVTGLFEVEVEIPNGDGLLRPGMVATSQIVTDRIYAYSAPETAVLFRSGQTYAFTIDRESAPLEVMYWDVGETPLDRARRVELTRWIDQGDRILIPADGGELSGLVVRGQQRLRDGQLVRVVNPTAPNTATAAADSAATR